MISSGQINCVVPKELDGSADSVVVQVTFGSTTPDFPVTVVSQDPGVFTFGGVGQGQAAILNFDSTTGSFTVNGSTIAAPRNSAISIFVTGVGDLDPTIPLANGAVAPATPISLAASPVNIHVDIDGQPAVITYAGTSPGAVAGLVQINAIVPPSASEDFDLKPTSAPPRDSVKSRHGEHSRTDGRPHHPGGGVSGPALLEWVHR